MAVDDPPLPVDAPQHVLDPDHQSVLADAFSRLAEAGALVVDDPRVAAEHFNWLVVSIPLNRAMILGDDQPATPTQLRRHADAGVDVFLAAYGSKA